MHRLQSDLHSELTWLSCWAGGTSCGGGWLERGGRLKRVLQHTMSV